MDDRSSRRLYSPEGFPPPPLLGPFLFSFTARLASSPRVPPPPGTVPLPESPPLSFPRDFLNVQPGPPMAAGFSPWTHFSPCAIGVRTFLWQLVIFFIHLFETIVSNPSCPDGLSASWVLFLSTLPTVPFPPPPSCGPIPINPTKMTLSWLVSLASPGSLSRHLGDPNFFSNRWLVIIPRCPSAGFLAGWMTNTLFTTDRRFQVFAGLFF